MKWDIAEYPRPHRLRPRRSLEFLTHDGLPTPGATGLYRIYVILTTGNEKGSNTVAITRTLP